MTVKNIIRGNKIAILIAVSVSLFTAGNVAAQVNLTGESVKIQLAYKNPAYLSFDVKYTYAEESAPSTVVDSSEGNFKISGTYYWGTIDSAEFMQNSSYAVMLYKPGKLISVNNPLTVYPQIANFSTLDSLLGKSGYTSSLTTVGSDKLITLTFSDPDNPYKNFKVYYDSTSSLVSKIVYTIRGDFLPSEENYNQSATGSTSDYVIVTALYTNYSTSAFSNTVFNTGNYFLINNGYYNPQPPYNDYEIFLGSPNLFLTHQSLD